MKKDGLIPFGLLPSFFMPTSIRLLSANDLLIAVLLAAIPFAQFNHSSLSFRIGPIAHASFKLLFAVLLVAIPFAQFNHSSLSFVSVLSLTQAANCYWVVLLPAIPFTQPMFIQTIDSRQFHLKQEHMFGIINENICSNFIKGGPGDAGASTSIRRAV
ncbi:hypothetical protein ACFSL6_20995 [Paenibacillus thailandensis]|uniref:hypothetical protein n=1 Tax=Paenibacillus thailandensis TaxID=393250 RepID=UPI00362AE624